MTREDCKRILQDADAHLSLARSALKNIIDVGPRVGHRDYMLAHDTAQAIDRQRARLARRIGGAK